MPELMEGITILNQIPIPGIHPVAWIIPSILAFVLVVVAIVFACVSGDPTWLVLILLSILVWVMLFVIIGAAVPVKTGEYYYEVTIDNSVSMNEFSSRYEIISQRGEIYKIKIKN